MATGVAIFDSLFGERRVLQFATIRCKMDRHTIHLSTRIRRVDVHDQKFGFVTATFVLHFKLMAHFDFDLFVIGGGSGGVRAARIAASHGARVGIAEEFRMGGTCVIRGCVPKKLLVYASRFASDYEDSIGYGWSYSDRKFDWHTLI